VKVSLFHIKLLSSKQIYPGNNNTRNFGLVYNFKGTLSEFGSDPIHAKMTMPDCSKTANKINQFKETKTKSSNLSLIR